MKTRELKQQVNEEDSDDDDDDYADLIDPEEVLRRREEIRVRQKQLLQKKRANARKPDSCQLYRELCARRGMEAEDEYCRLVWGEIDSIAAAEALKKKAEEQRALLAALNAAREEARSVGVDLRTPGITGYDRVHLLRQRIGRHHEVQEIVRDAIQKRERLEEQRPLIQKAIREFSNKTYIEKMDKAVDEKKCEHYTHMIKHGADPNHESPSGFTPLIGVILHGRKFFLRELVRLGVNPSFETSGGNTALIVAAAVNDVVITEVLLELGAKPDVETKYGVTALHYAADKGRIDVARALLEHGANVNKRNRHGITPLMQASKSKQVGIIRLFIRYGANSFLRDSSRRSAVDWAKAFGFSRLAMIIDNALTRGRLRPDDPLTYEEQQEITISQGARQTLKAAIEEGKMKVIIQTLREEYCVSPNFETYNGQTPLLSAISNGASVEQVTTLLKLGCIPSHQNTSGVSPLMLACRKNRLDIISLLLAYYKALPWLEDLEKPNQLPVVPFSAQALLLQRDHSGKDALMIAHELGRQELVNYMRKFFISPHERKYASAGIVYLGEPLGLTNSNIQQQKQDTQVDLQKAASTGNTEALLYLKHSFSTAEISPRKKLSDVEREDCEDDYDADAWRKKKMNEDERDIIRRCRKRGRRESLLLTEEKKEEGLKKYPHCQFCAKALARKKCKICCKVYCDRCCMQVHIVATRRHHFIEDVQPTYQLDGMDIKLAQEKRKTAVLPNLENCKQAVSAIRKLLKLEKEPEHPSKPADREVVQRRLDERLVLEQKSRNNVFLGNQRAATDADADGISVFRNPVEISMARFLVEQDRCEEAQDYLDQVHGMQLLAFGEQDPAVALTLREMANVEKAKKNYDNAVAKLQECLRILEVSLPVDNSDIIKTYELLIEALMLAKRFQDGVALSREVKRMRQDLLGNKHELLEDAQAKIDLFVSHREMEGMYALDPVAQHLYDIEINGERYALQAIGRLPEQFLELLSSESMSRTKFQQFAKDQRAEDNVEFWIAVHNFKQMDKGTKDFRERAAQIFTFYIKKKRIPALTAAIRNRIKKIYSTPGRKLPREIFTQAQELVFEILHEGIYLEFLDTEDGQRWIKDEEIIRKHLSQLLRIQRAMKKSVFRLRLSRRKPKKSKKGKGKKKKKGKKKHKATSDASKLQESTDANAPVGS